MPYSLPVHSQGRPGHRRSYSGAFLSLGDLPRRRSSADITTTTKFHFDDDESSSSHDENDTPLRLKITQNSFNAVPFPRSSPLPSPPLSSPPSVTRTSSTSSVLLLSNGKPLKSSLKSSSSSPHIPFPAQSLVPSLMFPDLHRKPQPHQRATSAPCSPLFATSSYSSSPSSASPSHSPTSPSSSSFHVSKNVHFPSQESGLATVRLFNRSARPASLSRLGEDTETETEGEGSSTSWSAKYVPGSTFPFPRVPKEKEKEKISPLNPQRQKKVSYDVDWSQSSIIPRKTLNLATENIYFESLQLLSGVDSESILQGTLLVRNITYQKTVMVRYTMDEWETVNDVLAGYYHPAFDKIGDGWDRFKFSISLVGRLENRVLWLVGKYAGAAAAAAQAMAEEGVEWWDNNQGKNYRLAFRKLDDLPVEQEETEKAYKRSLVVSAPPTYTTPIPSSTLTRPKLSAPQLSSASSFPSISFSAQQEHERERERVQHQAALAQSTMTRLKNLNLKNYAAPRGYGYPNGNGRQQSFSMSVGLPASPPGLTPPVLTLTSASPTTHSFVAPPPRLNTTQLEISSPTLNTSSSSGTATSETSVESSPCQTPVQQEDDKERWKLGVDSEKESLAWSLGMEHGHFATTLLPSSESAVLSSPPTTIPISIPGEVTGQHVYPYTTAVAPTEMASSPPFSDLGRSEQHTSMKRGGSVYWDWGSAVANVALGGVGREEVVGKVDSWMNHQPSSGSGALTPPQRARRAQHQRGSASSSSSSGSGSGSDSKSAKSLSVASPRVSSPLTGSSSSSTPTLLSSSPVTLITPKQTAAIPPKLNIPTRTFSPPPASAGIVQSPFPRRQHQRYGRHYPLPPPPSSPSGGEAAGGASSDAIYQALVREWCFAQGPGPVVLGSVGMRLESGGSSSSGQTTPVLPRLASPLSEGE